MRSFEHQTYWCWQDTPVSKYLFLVFLSASSLHLVIERYYVDRVKKLKLSLVKFLRQNEVQLIDRYSCAGSPFPDHQEVRWRHSNRERQDGTKALPSDETAAVPDPPYEAVYQEQLLHRKEPHDR
jgi:hypothetical protein